MWAWLYNDVTVVRTVIISPSFPSLPSSPPFFPPSSLHSFSSFPSPSLSSLPLLSSSPSSFFYLPPFLHSLSSPPLLPPSFVSFPSVELLLLLKWRLGKRDLKVVLTNVMCIRGEEVVKFLQDTLDCLFDILSTDSNKYGELVFDALVRIAMP